MKRTPKVTILISILITICISCSSQDRKVIADIVDSTCKCFDSLKYENNKITYLNQYHVYLKEFENSIFLAFEGNNIQDYGKKAYDLLVNDCKSFVIHYHLVKELEETRMGSRIIDSTSCSIMETGKFKSLGFDEIIITEMDSNIQIVKYLDKDFYEKSKVEWINECSYKLIFIETNEPMAQLYRKPGQIMVVEIIEIDNNIITYELEVNGRYILGKLEKIE